MEPGPWGHRRSKSVVPGIGHGWHVVPQPIGFPEIMVQQQQLDFVTAVVEGLKQSPSLNS